MRHLSEVQPMYVHISVGIVLSREVSQFSLSFQGGSTSVSGVM